MRYNVIMCNHQRKGNRGLIQAVVVIVVALLILSYFGINLRNVADSPTTQENFSFVWNKAVHIWESYLKKPAIWIWNEIVLRIIDGVMEKRNSLQNATSTP